MIQTKRSLQFLALLIVSTGLACSQKTTATAPANNSATATISATSTAINAPVLRGLDINPLIRVTVHIPAGKEDINLSSLQAKINNSALADLQKLEVYFTAAEPEFNSKNKVATVTPANTQLNIPVDISLKPGMNYIWFSAALKENADIDHQIELHCYSVIDQKNNVLKVSEDGSEFSKRIGVALRRINDDGVNSYRIPGMTTTDKGTLIAVYDIRYKHSGDLPANIDVGMSRSTDGGQTWEPMKNIMDMGEPHENNGVGDPSVLFDPVTKKLWVAALWSKGNRSIAGSEPGLSADTTGQFVLASSDDDGLTWNKPYSITGQVKDPQWHLYFNGPGNGIAMQNGTLVFPSQYWDESKKPGIPHSSIIYSDDHGKTWKSGIGAKSNTTESQVVETTPGTLMLSMRDNRGSFRTISTTTDMGKTWTEHATSHHALPDPVCMASLVKMNVKVNGNMQDVLFFSNPNTSFGRYDMAVQASMDLGETWQPANKTMVDGRKGFGYSALSKVDDETVGLVYEGVRELYFVRIPVSEIVR